MRCVRFAIFLLLLTSAARFSFSSQVVYVRQSVAQNAVQNGSSWVNAYRELRDALNDPKVAASAANNPIEIWVASGTYKPASDNDRTKSFALRSYLTVRGGFTGTETSVGQRPTNAWTVLSGDLGIQQTNGVVATNVQSFLSGTNSATLQTTSDAVKDNSYNVITCRGVNNVVLDRLVITGGNANNKNANGTEIFSPAKGELDNMVTLDTGADSSPKLHGAPLTDPSPFVMGGGIFVSGSYARPSDQPTVTLTDCILVGNAAASSGGGMAAFEANINASGCTFLRNLADVEGGAFSGLNQFSAFDACVFTENLAVAHGGAISYSTLPSEKTVPSGLSIQTQGELVTTVASGVKIAATAAKYAVSYYLAKTAGTTTLRYSDGYGFTSATEVPTENLLGPSELTLSDQAINAGSSLLDIYSLVSLAVTVGDFASDIAILAGVNPNSPDMKNWKAFSGFFNKYLSPLGILTIFSDAFGGDLGNMMRQPEMRDYQAEYVNGQLLNYNMAPYSRVNRCTFLRNVTGGEGAAAMVQYDNVEFDSCWFMTNNAAVNAGAVALYAWNTPKVFDCAFSGNVSSNGYSAIQAAFHSRPYIQSCTIVGNVSYDTPVSHPVSESFLNSVRHITNYTASAYCVGLDLGASAKIFNSVFWNNTSPNYPNVPGGPDLHVVTHDMLHGEAASQYDEAGPATGDFVAQCDLRYTTIQSWNVLPIGTEDFKVYDWNAPDWIRFNNSKLFHEMDDEGVPERGSYHELKVDNWSGNAYEGGPLRYFVNLGEGVRSSARQSINDAKDPHLVGRGGVIPLPNSPLLQHGADFWMLRGSNYLPPSPHDLYGISYGTPYSADRGAIQYRGAFQQGMEGYIFHVTQNGAGKQDGTSWADAYPGLGFASLPQGFPGGVEVWVAQGTYLVPHPTADIGATIPPGTAFYGGFAGNETLRTQRDWKSRPTIVNGENQSIFYANGGLLVDGVTFTNASMSAISPGESADVLQAANCSFFNCRSTDRGGAIAWHSICNLYNCKFVNCFAPNAGGAVWTGTGLGITNCWFENCSSLTGGGGVFSIQPISVFNSLFLSNSTVSGPGGSNSGLRGGAAIQSHLGDVSVYNSTFYGCSGPAIVIAGGGLPGLTNCLFYQNSGAAGMVISFFDQRTVPGQDFGGFDPDPLFASPADKDFSLSSDSPAIDFGSTNGLPVEFPTVDMAGNARVVRKIDLGAFEFQGTPTPGKPYSTQITPTFDQRSGVFGALIQFDAIPPSGSSPTSLRWQVNKQDGSGWTDISDGTLYQGTTTLHLSVWNPGQNMNGYFYRLSGVESTGARFFARSKLLSVYPPVLYVDGSRLPALRGSTNYDGLSWSTAFPYFYDAVLAARPGQQVWVARGTYYPLLTVLPPFSSDRTLTNLLQLLNGVQIMGGFAGTETNAIQRNPSANVTVLDASATAWVSITQGTNSNGQLIDNTFGTFKFGPPGASVFVNGPFVNRTAVLDGFTLTGTTSGAIVNNGGSPAILNCIFAGNSGVQGAAVASHSNANPLFSLCQFTANVAGTGTIYSENSQGDWINCLFYNNAALRNGGAFASSNSTVRLLQCTLAGNHALGTGGGIYQTNSTSIVQNSILWQNGDKNPAQIILGAQAQSDGASALIVTNTCIQGGATNAFNYDPLFQDPGAGNLHLSSFSPLINLANSALTAGMTVALDGNARTENGQVDLGCYQHSTPPILPAIYLFSLPQPLAITNAGVYNLALVSAGNAAGWTMEVDDNSGTGFQPIPSGNGLYNLTTNGNQLVLQIIITNLGNIQTGLSSSRYRVRLPSAGYVSAPVPLAQVSLPLVVYVNLAATGTTHNGKSWATAYTSLRDALDAPGIFGEIWVAKGVYPPPSGVNYYRLKEGIAIYGGFVGSETSRLQRHWTNNVTTLRGVLSEVIDCVNSQLTPATILDGFAFLAESSTSINVTFSAPTFANCTFDGATGVATREGGNPTIVNCVFKNAFRGMYAGPGSAPIIQKCLFTGNHEGLACFEAGAAPVILDSLFEGNETAIENAAGTVSVSRSIFRNNTSDAVNNKSSFICRSTLFQNNAGAGIYNWANLTAVNCTFTQNKNSGVYNQAAGNNSGSSYASQIRNCIFWNNSGRRNTAETDQIGGNADPYAFLAAQFSGYAIAYPDFAATYRQYAQGYLRIFLDGEANAGLAVSSSCIQGLNLFGGNGNIGFDPLLSNPGAGDFSPAIGSPAINAGDSSFVQPGETDITGQPRIFGSKVDLGAYELQKPGIGPLALVQAPASITGNALGAAAFTAVLVQGVSATNLFWQENRGSGWVTVTNGGVYGMNAVSNSATLTLSPLALTMNGYQYRVANTNSSFFSTPAILTVQQQVQIFVNASATGATNGLTWNTGYRRLLDALGAATAGKQIWVAGGTYVISNSLEMIPGVTLLGGFAGNELDAASRNAAINPVVLQAAPGVAVFSNAVLRADASSILDGFTISGGNTVAAMINNGVNPTIQNCLFTGNSNSAVLNIGSNPLFSNCVFSNNFSPGNGGAIWSSASAPRLIGCVFSDNRTTGAGGAVYSFNGFAPVGSPQHTYFEQCQFLRNGASGSGGGIEADRSITAFGPNVGGTEIEIFKCSFASNSAATGPGGAVNSSGDSIASALILINNSSFIANSAAGGGALQASQGAQWTVRNSLIAGNHSSNIGGGMANFAGSLKLYNCTFADNTSAGNGAGLFLTLAVTDVRNCIFWNNSNGLIDQSVEFQQLYLTNPYNDPRYIPLSPALPPFVTIRNCDLQGASQFARASATNLGGDPAFVDSPSRNYALQPFSFVVNAGDSTVAAGTDLANNQRVFGPAVDIGAYEVQTNAVPPIRVLVAPTPAVACDGTRATFGLLADAVNNVVWQVNTGSGFADIAANGSYTISLTSTSSVLAVRPVTLSMSGWQYRYRVANSIFTGPSLSLQVNPSRIAYVNGAATGTGNGSSWANAFTNPQAALNSGDCFSEIWVAQGTYQPLPGTPFAMKPFVGIYGGFAGTETNRAQRDYLNRPTILAPGTNTLVTMLNDGTTSFIDSSAILDGFVVRGAGGLAGINNFDASPTIRNCTFTSNASPAILNSYLVSGASPIISNCVFTANAGGAILNIRSSPRIVSCLFSNNIAPAIVGAAIANESGSPVITRSVFVLNSGSKGGAIHNSGTNANALVTYCIFQNNSALEGGAFYNAGLATGLLRDCLIARNSATRQGGALFINGGNVILANCTVTDNRGQFSGAGLWDESPGAFTATNCIFWGNNLGFVTASAEPAQIDGTLGHDLLGSSVFNCFVQGLIGSGNGNQNFAPFFANATGGDYHLVSFSPAINSGNDSAVALGDIDLDGSPRIVGTHVDLGCYEYPGAPGTPLTLTDSPSSISVCEGRDVTLLIAGPGLAGYAVTWQAQGASGFTNLANAAPFSISATSTSSALRIPAISTSFGGSAFRVILQNGGTSLTQSVFNIFVSPRTPVYVNGNIAVPGNGSAWTNAFATLADALGASGDCSDIWVAAGTYPAGGTSLQLKPGVRIFGGFFGNETSIDQRNPTTNLTILSGAFNVPVFKTSASFGAIDSFTTVDGFTISGGGGVPAVMNSGIGPTFRNCIFRNNASGAVMNSAGASPVFVGCLFTNNIGDSAPFANVNSSVVVSNCLFAGNVVTGNSGGAIYNSEANVIITGSRFAGNSASADGGAISIRDNSTVMLDGCILNANIASGNGGALGILGSSVSLTDSLLYGNRAQIGGAIQALSGGLSLVNDTITGNSALSGAGLNLGGTNTIVNSILWNNGLSGNEANQISGSASVSYSCIQGLNSFSGNHNIPYDPLFASVANVDFRLQDGSPAVDTGNSNAVTSGSVDLLGQPRFQGFGVDMGAYESAGVGNFVQILQQPVSRHLCEGDSASFFVLGPAGFGSQLIWQVDTGAGFGPLPSDSHHSVSGTSNSSTLIVTNATVSMDNYRYRVQIQGANRYSSAVVLNVSPHTILYVDASAAGNGTGADWINAFTDVQSALSIADVCHEIWVASGVYSNAVPFQLKNGVEIYGGFGNSEAVREARQPAIRITTLLYTGQTNLVQIPPPSANVGRPAILDGFTLASADTQAAGGSIVLVQGSSPIIRNCIFQNNASTGLLNSGGSPVVDDCQFLSNTVTAFKNNNGGSPVLSNCAFIGNQSPANGGAIYSVSGNLSVLSTVFSGNSALQGAAVYVDSGSPVALLDHCIISNNVAIGQGGALYNNTGSKAVVQNCLLAFNQANRGAAIANYGDLLLTSDTISANSAADSAGGSYNAGGNAVIINTILWGNLAAGPNDEVEGDYTISNSVIRGASPNSGNNLGIFDPLFVNPSAGNFHLDHRSPAIDAGIKPVDPSQTDLDSNARIQGNQIDIGAYESPFTATNVVQIASAPVSQQLACDGEPATSFSYVLGTALDYQWQSNTGGVWQSLGSGDVGLHGETYMLTVQPNTDGTITSTLTISNLTISLDGYQFRLAATNADFESRPILLSVGQPSVLYVNAAAPTNGNGLSWNTPFNNLASGLRALNDCRRILWLAGGTYSNASFVLPWFQAGVQIYGGFTGTETNTAQRTSAHPTIFQGTGIVITIDGSQGPIDQNTILDGLTVNGGQIGINIALASPLLTNCIIQSSSAGGMQIVDSSPRVVHCSFLSNSGDTGAGINISSPTLMSKPSIESSVFRGNHATISGAGLYSGYSSPSLVNCLFAGNLSDGSAGAIEFNSSIVKMVNCTVADNAASAGPAGGMLLSAGLTGTLQPDGTTVYFGSIPTTTITNSIFWRNNVAGGSSGSSQISITPGLLRNDAFVSTLIGGTSLDTDPLFLSEPASAPSLAGDFHLHASSPAIDAGSDGISLSLDLDGLPRVVNHPDLGAYEYQNSPLPRFTLGAASRAVVTNFSPFATVLTASAQGAGLTYRWQADRLDGNGFVNLTNGGSYSGASTSALTISNATPQINGFLFRAVITDQDGAKISSAPTTLVVIPTRWYVNSTAAAGGDGGSWATAFSDLQQVLANPVLGTTNMEIWVAAGTYYPSSVGDTNAAFSLLPNVAIYGGFTGSETNLNQRDWNVHPAILSGALDPGHNLMSAALFTNAAVDSSAILDGVTLTAASNLMINSSVASPRIANSSFTGASGHAIVSQSGALPYFTNCTFSGLASVLEANDESGNGATFDACLFTNNNSAGANLLDFDGGLLEILRSQFSGNQGALVSVRGGSLLIQASSFTNNSGLAVFYSGANLGISDSQFLGNGTAVHTEAGGGGGITNSIFRANGRALEVTGNQALFNVIGCGFFEQTDSAIVNNSSFLLLYGCRIQGNRGSYGGGIYASAIDYGVLNMGNCLVTGNYARNAGGGLYIGNISILMDNCTVAANRADGPGGAVFGCVDGINNIFWNNYGLDASGNRDTSLGPDNSFAPVGNAGIDPIFVNAIDGANAPSLAGDFHLTPSSPLIDTGNEDRGFFIRYQLGDFSNSYAGVTDLDGFPRQVRHIDLGAFEFQGTPASQPLTLVRSPDSVVYFPTLRTSQFSVAATGAGLTYQWQVNHSDGNGWLNVTNGPADSGANSATLTILSASLNDDGAQYRVLISSSAGGTILSHAATLTVNPLRWYVRASAPDGGDGRTWATAFNQLPSAFVNPRLIPDSTEIWVAEGTYYPSLTGNRFDYLFLTNGVSVFGGFGGFETNLADRVWTNHASIISGDVQDPNGPAVILFHQMVFGSSTFIDRSTRLDGFILSTAIQGIVNEDDASPTIANCTFQNIGSSLRGGTHTYITNCLFQNYSTALFLVGDGQIRNSTFAGGSGAQAITYNYSVLIDSCLITGNDYGLRGFGNGTISIHNSTLSSNGVAVFLGGSSSILDHSIFQANTQVAVQGNSTPSLHVYNCLFSGNATTATNAAAAINLNGGNPFGTPNCEIRSSTFTGNLSGGPGAAISTDAPLIIFNSILWNNQGATGFTETDQIALTSTNAVADARFNAIQGLNSAGPFAGHSNTNANPLFVSPIAATNAPTADGKFALLTNSPLIDAGDNSLVAPIGVDLGGLPRIQNHRVDLGAYEHPDSGPATPVISWGDPGTIFPGNPLSAAQLNATSSVPGTFQYTPDFGTLLASGANTLTTVFTPTDTTHYEVAHASVTVTVFVLLGSPPPLSWSPPSSIMYGTPLDTNELNATATSEGSFTYDPPLGTILGIGADQILTAVFTPSNPPGPTITMNRPITVTPARIAGKIAYYGGQMPAVPGVLISLSGDASAFLTNADDGTFEFLNNSGGAYTIHADKVSDSSPSAGVTTADITLIRRHILGLVPLDSPYKILAADVNNSGSVTTLDITLIRQFILGVRPALPGGIWKFVSSSYQFPNPSAPWNPDTQRAFSGIVGNVLTQDFTAIKLGDVNASWTQPTLSGQSVHSSSSANVQLSLGQELVIKSGQSFIVPVKASRLARLLSVQFTLKWNPSVVEFAGIRQFGLPGLSADNFGVTVDQGQLTFSWDDPNGLGVNLPDGTEIFSLQFHAIGSAGTQSGIYFGDRPTVREWMTTAGVAHLQTADQPLTIGTAGVKLKVLETNGIVCIEVPTQAGILSVLESANSLDGSPWQELREITGTGAMQVIEIGVPEELQRFYRLRQKE